MSRSCRKRSTKWDLKESPEYPLCRMKENGYLEQKSSMNKEINKDSMRWNEDRGYSTEMSPGLDDWRRQNRPCSPRDSSSRSFRGRTSRCRSRSQSRDRHRSRSRSRSRRSTSRSRGWSRSPGHHYRKELDVNNRERKQFKDVEYAKEPCRNFSAGRCTRGSKCQFLHHGSKDLDSRRHAEASRADRLENRSNMDRASDHSTFDANCRAQHRQNIDCCLDFLRGSCKRGNSCRYSHNLFANEKERDRRNISPLSEKGSGVSNVPCKFYAAGNCRNGKDCRFSHHKQIFPSIYGVLEERRQTAETDVYNLEKIDGSMKWNDSLSLMNAATSSAVGNEKLLSAVVTVDNMHIEDKLDNYLESMIEHPVVHVDNASTIVSCGNYSLQSNQQNSTSKRGISSSNGGREWLHDMDDCPEWDFNEQSHKDEALKHPNQGSQCLTFTNPLPEAHEQHEIQNISGQRNSAGPIVQPMHLEGSLVLQNFSSSLDDCPISPISHNPGLSSTSSSAIHIVPDTSCNQIVYSVGLGLSSMNANGQEQSVPLTPLKHSIPAYSLQSQIQIEEEQKKVVYNEAIPQTSTGILSPQNGVHSEQLAQLTEFSASLAQLLSGKQLPQLYATLNAAIQSQNLPPPPNSTGDLAPPLSSQQNSIMESYKQYDPLCDSIEPTIPGQPIGSMCPVDDTEGSKQAGVVTVSEININREPNHDMMGIKEQPGNDPSSGLDEKNNSAEGRKNTDPHAVRTFKFALVDFVKDLLKPTWKDGKINREIYKTIVKKVVDKVTSIQGEHIPQTQEKIKQYLSFSKPKLAKLVEAYVGKHQK